MKSVVVVGGVRIEVDGPADVVVNGTDIRVNGRKVEGANISGQTLAIKLEAGVVGSVKADGSVTCGDVGGNVDAGGSVSSGSVKGNVDAGGSVKVDGSVTGKIDAGGSVKVGR